MRATSAWLRSGSSGCSGEGSSRAARNFVRSVLTLFPRYVFLSSSGSAEGVVARRSDDGAAGEEMPENGHGPPPRLIPGQPGVSDAAPAREARNLAPGRFRDPTGRHYDRPAGSSARQAVSATSFAPKRVHGVEPARRGPKEPSRCVPGSADPGSEIAAVERREAPALSLSGARLSRRLVRRSVLHSLRNAAGVRKGPAARGQDDGLPGAA